MHLNMVVDALVALHMRSVDSGWCLTCNCRQKLNHCSIPTFYWQNLHVHCKTDSLRKILTKNAALTVLSIQHFKLRVHFSTSTKRGGLTHREELSRQLHLNGVKIQFTLFHWWCISGHNMSACHLFYFLLVGMSLRPARTTRLRAPIPVQAAHCTGVRGTVWNHFPPYCTITTCSHSGQSANEHQLNSHCYFLMQYSDV